MPPYQIGWVDSVERTTKFCKRVREIKHHYLAYGIMALPFSAVARMKELSYDCHNLRSPNNELCALFPHLINTQERIVSAFRCIYDYLYRGDARDWVRNDRNSEWHNVRWPSESINFVGEYLREVYDALNELDKFVRNEIDTNVLYLW